ncbi:Uncharacterised protein [Bordetella pertussis]|nr:Uncharacterised protein [Bordetella pertussis]
MKGVLKSSPGSETRTSLPLRSTTPRSPWSTWNHELKASIRINTNSTPAPAASLKMS